VGKQQLKLLAVFGSGGHTMEMFKLLFASGNVAEKFDHRVYVVAETDNLSLQKVLSLLFLLKIYDFTGKNGTFLTNK
jgi:hypothetical protein